MKGKCGPRVGFEVLTAVTTKIVVFWEVSPCSPDYTASVFKEEEENKQVKGKEAEECLLNLVYNPEDGGGNYFELSVKFSLTVRHNLSENGGPHKLRNLRKICLG
jgi:hypothetical protein